tara:strand:- start:789 stop:1637 length:849 start_codon:yes stop_codon:yes gene_type:complete
MAIDININGTLTAIEEVSFNGDTDIQTINVDGTDVWVKPPTALEVASGLYDSYSSWIKGIKSGGTVDTNGSPTSRTYSSSGACAAWRNTGDHAETFGSYSISESPPLDSSPNNTAVFMQYGQDFNGSIDSLKVNGDSITTADGEYSDDGSVAVGYTDTGFESITSTGANFIGFDYNNGSYVGAMILPGKWDITSISSPQTMAPGDIWVSATNTTSDRDGHYPTYDPDYWNSTPPLVFQQQLYWYKNAQLGIWCNNTSSDISVSWSRPSILAGVMVRLRHIGI